MIMLMLSVYAYVYVDVGVDVYDYSYHHWTILALPVELRSLVGQTLAQLLATVRACGFCASWLRWAIHLASLGYLR